MLNIKAVLSTFLAAVISCSSTAGIVARADEAFESGKEAVSSIGAGWNLGNTLDSYGTAEPCHIESDDRQRPRPGLQCRKDPGHLVTAYKQQRQGRQ